MPNKKTKERERVLQRPINIYCSCVIKRMATDNNWLLMEMMVINVQYVFFVSV